MKFLSFRDELDAVVFPCLGELESCQRLMQEISERDGFVPEATWLAIYAPPGSPLSEPCGTIQAIRVHRTRANIQNIGVTPHHRGRGVGAALIVASLAGLQQVGVTRVGLEVTADNDVAVRLYRRLGFRVVKTLYKAADEAPRAVTPAASVRSARGAGSDAVATPRPPPVGSRGPAPAPAGHAPHPVRMACACLRSAAFDPHSPVRQRPGPAGRALAERRVGRVHAADPVRLQRRPGRPARPGSLLCDMVLPRRRLARQPGAGQRPGEPGRRARRIGRRPPTPASAARRWPTTWTTRWRSSPIRPPAASAGPTSSKPPGRSACRRSAASRTSRRRS